MTSPVVRDKAATFVKPRPEIRPGYTVRVHEKIKEGDKERVQIFEGLVIAVHKGATPTDSTITVRKIASGVGVEKVFSLHSPKIEKIEVKKVAKVRRSKLFFLRGRRGKAARLSERFTTADEFAIAAAVAEEEEVPAEDIVEEAPEEDTADPAPQATHDTEEPTEEAKSEAKEEASAEAKEDPAPQASQDTEEPKEEKS